MGGIGHGGNKHKAELSPSMSSTPDITEGGLLDGRVRLRQPARGYRAGMDAALLAAACDARPGDRVLEAGCGAGGALLDAGTYSVSLARIAAGERPTRVQATMRRTTTGVDATVAATVEFSSGAISTPEAEAEPDDWWLESLLA